MFRKIILLIPLFSMVPFSAWSQGATPAPEIQSSSPSPAEEAPTKKSFWKDDFEYSGELRQETALRISSPVGFSNIKEFAKMDLKFHFNEHIKLKIGGRGWYDAAYSITNHYPQNVRDNMIKEGALRDAYLDISASQVNIRLGHQQIVWGEALGQFFADVVNPRELREFLLPDFDYVRLPIWALDLQYTFLPNATFEVVVSPDQTVDKLALPGADFAFFIPPPPTGVQQTLLPDNRPPTNFKNWNAGTRISFLVDGWDLTWLYYTTLDHEPALFKRLYVDPTTGIPQITLDPQHHRIQNYGMTFSKSVSSYVVRGEFVLTTGRFFNGTNVAVNQGVFRAPELRYEVGLDADLPGKVTMNAEFQQQAIFASQEEVAERLVQTWVFLRFAREFLDKKLTPEMIFIVGLQQGDTQVSPRLHYNVTPDLKLTWGADIFDGPQNTLYGQFSGSKRIFMFTSWKF